MMMRLVCGGGLLLVALGVGFRAEAQSAAGPAQKESAASNVGSARASGPLEVKMTALPPDDKAQDATVGRMLIEKQYHGDLEGMGKGQMLTAGTDVKGSAAYVAIERVSGTLHGRAGTFVLQHSGAMTSKTRELSITVVPDSGTGQLAGISGKMNIIIGEGGKHSYEFVYALPNANK
jgi:hypothetical protein